MGRADPPKLDEALETEMNDLDQKSRQVGEGGMMAEAPGLQQKHQPLQAEINDNDFPSV